MRNEATKDAVSALLFLAGLVLLLSIEAHIGGAL